MSIETKDLINILAQTSPQKPMRLSLFAAVMMCVTVIVTMGMLGLRHELLNAQLPHSFWIKTALLIAMAIISLRSLMASSKPVAKPQSIWPYIMLAVAAVVLISREWLTTDHQTILGYFKAINFPCCLLFVTLYGSFGTVGFVFLMRHYAPAHSARCAGLIGLAAAAVSAVGYSIHCPFDSPIFVVVAYGVPQLILYVASRLVVSRFIRW